MQDAVAHGPFFSRHDLGGKVPQRRGHGPRTHDLQRHVREFAVVSLVSTEQNVVCGMASESIETLWFYSFKCTSRTV